ATTCGVMDDSRTVAFAGLAAPATESKYHDGKNSLKRPIGICAVPESWAPCHAAANSLTLRRPAVYVLVTPMAVTGGKSLTVIEASVSVSLPVIAGVSTDPVACNWRSIVPEASSVPLPGERRASGRRSAIDPLNWIRSGSSLPALEPNRPRAETVLLPI